MVYIEPCSYDVARQKSGLGLNDQARVATTSRNRIAKITIRLRKMGINSRPRSLILIVNNITTLAFRR